MSRVCFPPPAIVVVLFAVESEREGGDGGREREIERERERGCLCARASLTRFYLMLFYLFHVLMVLLIDWFALWYVHIYAFRLILVLWLM